MQPSIDYQVYQGTALSAQRESLSRQCAAILRAADPQNRVWDRRAFYRDMGLPETSVALATVNQQPVGFLTATRWAVEWQVTMVAVLPDWQRHGIGHQLLKTWLMAVPHADVTLTARASQLVAQGLYRQCGFVEIDRIDAYYERPVEAAIKMRRMDGRGTL